MQFRTGCFAGAGVGGEETKPSKGITKVAIFTNNDDFCGFVDLKKTLFVAGYFPKCIFAEGSFNQKPLALGEIRGAIWRYFVMKLPSKNVKNHENLRFRNSVRPDPAAPGPRKLRVVFPLISVLPKPPQLPYGAKYFVLAENSVFQFCSPYWSSIGPSLAL